MRLNDSFVDLTSLSNLPSFKHSYQNIGMSSKFLPSSVVKMPSIPQTENASLFSILYSFAVSPFIDSRKVIQGNALSGNPYLRAFEGDTHSTLGDVSSIIPFPFPSVTYGQCVLAPRFILVLDSNSISTSHKSSAYSFLLYCYHQKFIFKCYSSSCSHCSCIYSAVKFSYAFILQIHSAIIFYLRHNSTIVSV